MFAKVIRSHYWCSCVENKVVAGPMRVLTIHLPWVKIFKSRKKSGNMQTILLALTAKAKAVGSCGN